jgi:hypothetical protein
VSGQHHSPVHLPGATPARNRDTAIPWTVVAWAATANQPVPHYTLTALREDAGKVPDLATFRGGASGREWHTLHDLRNFELQRFMLSYAITHGHSIPVEVTARWVAQHEATKITLLVRDAVSERLDEAVESGVRDRAVLLEVAQRAALEALEGQS